MGASPDGLIIGEEKIKLLEIKCPKTRKIMTSGDKIVPSYYLEQMQLQMECADVDFCDFWQCEFKILKMKSFWNNFKNSTITANTDYNGRNCIAVS